MTNQAKWAGQLRHFITAAGGVLVALGVARPGESTTLIETVNAFFGSGLALAGAASIIGGNIMSWISPAKKVGEGD